MIEKEDEIKGYLLAGFLSMKQISEKLEVSIPDVVKAMMKIPHEEIKQDYEYEQYYE